MRIAALLALCVLLGAGAARLVGRDDVERVTETRTVTRVETIEALRRTGTSVATELRTRSPDEIPDPEVLAPEGTSPTVSYVPEAGGKPAQLVVRWAKGARKDPREYGVAVWQWDWESGWRHAFRRYYGFHSPVHTKVIPDLTGDGHKEIWLEVDNGTGSCGPRSILATVRGRVDSAYESGDVCLTRWTFLPRGLRVEDGVAPCGLGHNYRCFHGHRTREYRWNGSRFALVRIRVRCDSPKLDPESGCAPS